MGQDVVMETTCLRSDFMFCFTEVLLKSCGGCCRIWSSHHPGELSLEVLNPQKLHTVGPFQRNMRHSATSQKMRAARTTPVPASSSSPDGGVGVHMEAPGAAWQRSVSRPPSGTTVQPAVAALYLEASAWNKD